MNPDSARTARSLAAGGALERQVQVGEVDDLIARIQSADDQVRGAAWQGAASAGAAAIQPLARLLTHTNFEVARSAKHALYRVVRQAGRPGARRELGLSQAVQK